MGRQTFLGAQTPGDFQEKNAAVKRLITAEFVILDIALHDDFV